MGVYRFVGMSPSYRDSGWCIGNCYRDCKQDTIEASNFQRI